MKKVILTKGLPGSGKTYWTKELMAAYPGRYKRVNKDDLRAMIDNGKWSKHNEQFILKIRDSIILAALEEGCHVVVDDTNLHDKHEQHIRDVVKGLAVVEIKDFTDVPLETCLERDRKRQNYVGEQVIKSMYKQFLQSKPIPPVYNPNLPIALIYDLDGTVALFDHHRGPFDASTCEEDLPNVPVISIIRSFFGTGMRFIAVSGRQEKDREPTERWLQRNQLPYDALHMRQVGDQRKDAEMKREIYEQHIQGKYTIHLILDDRVQMVQMWRSLGLTCLQVADGDY